MNLSALQTDITSWLRLQLSASGKDGFVLGISGGVDSCVLTHMLHAGGFMYESLHYQFDEAETGPTHPVIQFLQASTKLRIAVQDMQPPFMACMTAICTDPAGTFEHYLFRAILKAKLAHADLGYKATKRNSLVLGTINKDEFSLGYFVKNTCTGDLLPFADVPKATIRALGQQLGIPRQITDIKASGCVWGTYAESEWGITEEEMQYLVSGKAGELAPSLVQRFQELAAQAEHKRHFAPAFMFSRRAYE